jgi:hypothetical protein
MSDCQGKVGTSGTGLTSVIAPLSLTGTELSLSTGSGLSVSGSNLITTPRCNVSCYVNTGISGSYYVTGSTLTGSPAVYVPNRFGFMYTDTSTNPLTLGEKGFIAPFTSAYLVTFNWAVDGTTGYLLVGYFHNSKFYNYAYTGNLQNNCISTVMKVPQGAEIYIYNTTGTIAATTNPSAGGTTVAYTIPLSSFSISSLLV